MPQSLLERVVRQSGSRIIADTLTPAELEQLPYIWQLWARPNQLPPPGDWRTWLVMAGRGFGKTRTGAEWVRDLIETGHARRVALIGRTVADVRDVMVEGDSGILAVCPPDFKPLYEPTKRKLTWPNGAIATTYSADQPDVLRGPQHDHAWADEVATWQYAEAWDNLMLGLRLGKDPRCIVTTTPRPTKIIRQLVKDKNTVITKGSTYENRANLADAFFDQIIKRYEGTTIGRQELHAELLEDMPGALWMRSMFNVRKACEHYTRIVVAVDPSVSTAANPDADECGIVVDAKGQDGLGYVLADRSGRLSPDAWAQRAVQAYYDFKADCIVAEANQGGEMVRLTIHTVDRNVPVKLVNASRGKQARAEPVAALYEQHRVFHVKELEELEDQLCMWTPESGDSPDRLDANVWGLTELFLKGSVWVA